MVDIVNVPGGRLAAPAAASYLRMLAAGMPGGLNSTYRTWAEQNYFYQGFIHHRPGFNFALPPGTSVHEKGFAGDFPAGPRAWLVQNGHAYGWRRTNPNESWHYEYFEGEDAHRTNRNAAVSAAVQRALRQADDGFFGDGSRYALTLIQNALNGAYPNPVDLQNVVGVTADGIPGPATKAAVHATVADLQRALGITADGIWGAGTQAAIEKFLVDNYKTW